MEPQELFKELMKDESLQTRLNISKEDVEKADFMTTSDNKNIEVIIIIDGATDRSYVVNHKKLNTVYRGIQNLLS